MSVTPRREENAVFLETGSNSVMLFSIALCIYGFLDIIGIIVIDQDLVEKMYLLLKAEKRKVALS